MRYDLPRKSRHRLRVFGFCLLWGDVTDGGVDAPPIVIAFDIGKQVAPRAIAIGVFAVVNQLGFQSAKEALHRRIVPAVSLAAHRLDDSGGLQDVAILASGVLAAAIGMMDQSRSRAPSLERAAVAGYADLEASDFPVKLAPG